MRQNHAGTGFWNSAHLLQERLWRARGREFSASIIPAMKTPRGSAKENSFISGSTKTARGRLEGSSASTITPPRSKSGPSCRSDFPPNKESRSKEWGFFYCAGIPSLANCSAMEITYELTRKDFTESFAAHRNRRAWARWTRRIVASLMLLFSALLLFGSVRTGNTRTLLPFFALVAMWLVY